MSMCIVQCRELKRHQKVPIVKKTTELWLSMSNFSLCSVLSILWNRMWVEGRVGGAARPHSTGLRPSPALPGTGTSITPRLLTWATGTQDLGGKVLWHREKVLWPGGQVHWPGRQVLWPGGQVLWPGRTGTLTWGTGTLTSDLGERYTEPGEKLFWPQGQIFWPRGQIFWPERKVFWPKGQIS